MPSSVDQQQRNDLMLLPYFLLIAFYMYTFQPFFHLPPETFTAAFCKAAPIWYLAGYVGLSPRFPDNCLAQGIRMGLVLSSLGDMCLVWRKTLFLPGMFFFALAHLGYIHGLHSWLRQSSYRTGGKYGSHFVILCIASNLYIFPDIESRLMAVCVIGYSVFLFLMAYLTVQRYLLEQDRGSCSGAVGGISFLVSDFLIAFSKWKIALPLSEFFVLATYYLAQCAIADSAVHTVLSRKRR